MGEPDTKPRKAAWVTLLTKPGYLPGTLVLQHSLRAVGSKYPLVAMVSPDLPPPCRDALLFVGIELVEIDKITPKAQSPRIKEERFKEAWSKLKCFNLYQYDRACLVDSDMLIRQNIDELLEMDLEADHIAASHACTCNPRKFAHYPPDWKPENCAFTHPTNPPPMTADSPRTYGLLNAGLFVCNPSEKLYAEIERFLEEDPRVETFQFTDQDLLATLFEGKWDALPYTYNALKTLRIVHQDLWKDADVKNIHYILGDKPWNYKPTRGGPPESEYHDVDLWWWDSYEELERELKEIDSEESRRVWQYVQTFVGVGSK